MGARPGHERAAVMAGGTHRRHWYQGCEPSPPGLGQSVQVVDDHRAEEVHHLRVAGCRHAAEAHALALRNRARQFIPAAIALRAGAAVLQAAAGQVVAELIDDVSRQRSLALGKLALEAGQMLLDEGVEHAVFRAMPLLTQGA